MDFKILLPFFTLAPELNSWLCSRMRMVAVACSDAHKHPHGHVYTHKAKMLIKMYTESKDDSWRTLNI